MYLNNLEIPIEFQDHSQGHMGFGVFFCVHDAVATSGQYILSLEQGLMILFRR